MKRLTSFGLISMYTLCTAASLAVSSSGHLVAQPDTLSIAGVKGQSPSIAATADNPNPMLVPAWIQAIDSTKTQQATWDVQFGMAFPMRDFHDSDPENPLAGYAMQGYTLGASMMIGFGGKGNTGWHFGIAYTGMRLHTDFRDSVFAAVDRAIPSLGSGFVPEEDYKPRYDMIRFNTGWAYEGSSENVAAYARITLGFNMTRISGTTLESLSFADVNTSSRLALSTGHSIEFGLRFQKQLSLGLAWHYLGEPDMNFGLRETRPGLPGDVFDHLSTQRRIHLLEVKLGYGFDLRGRPKRQ